MGERDESVIVRFVKVTEDFLDIMQEAFKGLSEVGARCVWFVGADCLQVTKRDKRIFYVFSTFSGRFFEHIASTGSRIYGPSCILQCLKNGEHLPRLPHPVFSKAMEGLVISCTNLPSKLRDELHQRVIWMMGEASKDFHERVTHLVAGEVGSKKYTVAVSLKKKIVQPEWVSVMWEKCHTGLVHASDSQFDSLRCPPFKGYIISVSGFDNEERTRIKNLVEQAGGQYSGEMKINECTHLVVTMARGQKYEFALKWKINIVSPKWIDDCISSGYCLQEHLYAVEKPVVKTGITSTPTGEGLEAGHSSALVNLSAVSMTTVNDTALQRHLSTTSLQTQGQLPRSRDSSFNSIHKVPTKTAADSVTELLDSVDLQGARAGFFLDGCKIYVSGVSSSHMERVRRLINLGGGTRFNQINESVSHVVIGEIAEETVQRLQQATFRPQIVSIRWLVDCFRKGQCLPEDLYRCMDLPEVLLTSLTLEERLSKRSSVKSFSEPPAAVTLNNSRTMEKTLTSNESHDDMQEVLSQYMGFTNNVTSLGESTLMRAADAGEARAASSRYLEASNSSRQDEESTLYVPPNADGDCEIVEADGGLLFHKLKFLVFGFEGEEEEMLCDLIKENGGTLLPRTTRFVPDYGVVPLFGCPVKASVGEVVTNAWLQMSVERERVLPVERSVMYSPLPFMPDARPFLGCILSISGYSGIERDVLLQVSNALGGKCQDYFLRRPKGNLLASTHLIVKSAEGSKYIAAKKWNIPAVNKMWLFECARTGKQVDVERFLVDSFPDESSDSISREAEVEAVAQPVVATGNIKRLSECPSESLVPAKRSRNNFDGDAAAKENLPDIESLGENSSVKTLKGTVAMETVFKEPALPCVGGAAVGGTMGIVMAPGSRSIFRSSRSSSASSSDSITNPVFKTNNKLTRKGKHSSSNEEMAPEEGSKSSTDGLLFAVPSKRGAALVKESEALVNNGSPAVKKRSSGNSEDVNANAKVPETCKGWSETNIKPPEMNTKPESGNKLLSVVEKTNAVSVLEDFVSSKTSSKSKVDGGELRTPMSSGKSVTQASSTESLPAKSTPKKSKAIRLDSEIGKDTETAGKDTESTGKERNSLQKLKNLKEMPTDLKSSASHGKMPKNSRLEELIQDGRRVQSLAGVLQPAATAVAADTPSKFMGSEAYHAKLDLNGVLSPWTSPMEVSKKPKRISLPLEEVFAENIGIAVKNSMSGLSKEESFSQKIQDDNYCLGTETTSGPLKGVVIAVAKKLIKNQTEYNNIAASLGAEYQWTYDNNCTHFIFQGRLNDTNREFRLARDQGKSVVSPHWLMACEEQSKRVDEACFPHTYNPNLSLSITAHKTPAHHTRFSSRTNATVEASAVRNSNAPIKALEPVASVQSVAPVGKPTVAAYSSLTLSTRTTEPSTTIRDHGALPTPTKKGVASRCSGSSKTAGRTLVLSTESTEPPTTCVNNAMAKGSGVPTVTAVTKTDSTKRVIVSTAKEKALEEAFDATDATLSDEDIATACDNVENQEKSSRESTLLDGLKRLNEASKNQGRGKPLTRILSSEREALNVSDLKANHSLQDISIKEDNEETKSVQVTASAKSNTAQKIVSVRKLPNDLHTQPSQFVEVLWDDPGAREQREMMASDLEKNSESPGHDLQAVKPMAEKADITSNKERTVKENEREPESERNVCSSEAVTTVSVERTTSIFVNPNKKPLGRSEVQKSSDDKDGLSDSSNAEAPGVAEEAGSKPKRVFIFSGLSPEERDRFAAAVEKLGGVSMETANYINECTHLIIEKPTRNEKYLASVASGKWVLHKSYLDACLEANKFLPEESYEWGGKGIAVLWNNLPQQLVRLAEAAHRWRFNLAKLPKTTSKNRGSFVNWRVLLLTESRREDGFQRLLEAGGATVLSNKLPLDYSKTTHAFIDLSKLKFQIDLEGMVRANVACLKPEYIASYLTDDPVPNPGQFFIPEAEKFLR